MQQQTKKKKIQGTALRNKPRTIHSKASPHTKANRKPPAKKPAHKKPSAPKKLEKRSCKNCGKKFLPFDENDWGCSPICRAMIACKTQEADKRAQEIAFKKKMAETKYIPKLNLHKNPMARVEWVLRLPIEYRAKFSRFFTPEERAYSNAIERSRLAEERQYLGYFVKKDKIVLVKGEEEHEAESAPDHLDNDGTENED